MTHLDDVIELLTRDRLTPAEAESAAKAAGWSASFVAVPGADEVSHARLGGSAPALAELVERYGEARMPPPRPGTVQAVIEVPKDPSRRYDATLILDLDGERVVRVTVRRDIRL
jgi:hypothetical protein